MSAVFVLRELLSAVGIRTPTQKNITKAGEDPCSACYRNPKMAEKLLIWGLMKHASQLMEVASELILEESIFYKQRWEKEQKEMIMHRACSRLINDCFMRAYYRQRTLF